jgi:ammonia channel protein AmtB
MELTLGPLLASAEPSSGNLAWMLMACAMVLLMTPALAFFYGGLVRSKNSLNTMFMSFAPYLLFISLWVLAVYAPICHWVWGGSWLAEMGALDFAGGTVVHINAGIAAIVAARLLGCVCRPHDRCADRCGTHG